MTVTSELNKSGFLSAAKTRTGGNPRLKSSSSRAQWLPVNSDVQIATDKFDEQGNHRLKLSQVSLPPTQVLPSLVFSLDASYHQTR